MEGAVVDDEVPARRLAELVEASKAGRRPRLLCFWGHRPQADGGVGRGCLSQWWPCTFELDGQRYRSAEHWMMAAKARLFGDEAMARAIIAAGHPGKAKALGREVAGYDEARWRAERFGIVVRGNLAKFSQDPALGAWLLGTGNQVLVEASPVDPVWGIGLAADDARTADPALWPGLNLLGFALMEVRDQLASGQVPLGP
jgi:ribA/ribD-fused uncharacterized protein